MPSYTPNIPGTNSGHGYVWARPDGAKARCGGAILCGQCKADYDHLQKQNLTERKTTVSERITELLHFPELAEDNRLVLAVLKEGLPPYLQDSGYHQTPSNEYAADTLGVIQKAGCFFGPRDLLEISPVLRQVIPYTVIRWKDKILTYTRTPKGGEQRLHNKISVGFGGHIEINDANPEMTRIAADQRFDLESTLREAAHREVREEIGDIGAKVKRRNWTGFIIENAGLVNQCHIGLVNVWELEDDFDVKSLQAEDAVGHLRFLRPREVYMSLGVEPWSMHFLKANLGWT